MPELLFHPRFEGYADKCLQLIPDDLSKPYRRWVLGRNAALCDLLIDHPWISSQHFAIIRQRYPGKDGPFDQYSIEDLGSRNGTFLNGIDLKPFNAEPLEPNAKISLGWPEGAIVFIQDEHDTVPARLWSGKGWPLYKEKAELPEDLSILTDDDDSPGTIGTPLSPMQPNLDNQWEFAAWAWSDVVNAFPTPARPWLYAAIGLGIAIGVWVIWG